MASAKYEHNCFFCAPCLVLINVNLNDENTKAGALPIQDGEKMPCSGCGKELTARKQESWMTGMCCAQAVPWDEDRKAKCRDYALTHERPPMSEQAKFRMSMNAFQTGLHAKKHHLPPARPGKYKACKLCPYASPDFHEFGEGDSSCEKGVAAKEWHYCVQQSQHIAEWINASAMGKTNDIREILGDIHARMVMIAKNSADRIAIDGIMKELTYTKYENGKVKEQGVSEIIMSPHFKALMDIADRLNMKLENFLLTPKSVSDKEVAETTAAHISAIFGKKPTILDNPNPDES